MDLRIPLLVAALALPAAATAQTVAGTVSGRLDGDPASWSVLDGSETATGWQDVDGGIEVTLDAYPEATEVSDEARLRITFVAAGTMEAREAEDPRVTLATADGEISASGENVDLSLTDVAVEGDSLVVSGNLVAQMVEGGTEELLIGTDRGTAVDGNFQATVFRTGE